MSDDPAARGAQPVGRLITAEEYHRLAEIGVLGEQVELIDGRIVFGRYPFALSDEAIAAARAHGIELDPPERGAGYTLASLGTPPAVSDRPSEAQERRLAGPGEELARTLAARTAWSELEPLLLALIEGGVADVGRAVQWLAAPHQELDGDTPAGWIVAGRDPERAVALAADEAAELASDAPDQSIDPASIEAVTALALRLGRVMRPDHVPAWLYKTGIEGLGADRPIDLIARGEISYVARLVSELEDPGAT